ncbi:phosphatidylglycerophosphatase A family protein [Pseudogemmobacter bohemicus]|uniref:phosphatidylglycerophosphatase A family protein n=1 Tax=Pseudogemmobacter bohemicus TaxID=2250708 RepID=UPI000DD2F448|nr:phosphatidylglycerophosphatase A [Pseudogemmobacter bohemicus]
MINLTATFFGIGHIRPASGTWASLAAALLALLAMNQGLYWLVPVAAVLATGFGFWAVPQYLRGRDDTDPSEVVIDEVAGQWIAISFVAIPAMQHGLDVGLWWGAWPAWAAPFLLFRLFDIWKPWIIGRADRRGDATGVMLDDLIAGLFAGIGSVILAGLYHGVVKPWLM